MPAAATFPSALPDHPGRPPPLHAVVEAARLAALRSYGAAGTGRTLQFDLLAQQAAHCMRAPAGLVMLVDKDRLWVSGAYGAAFESAPRLGSFCDHVVGAAEGWLLVRDAAADPQFQALPWVAGPPHIRFYAGAVIQDEDGYRLGTVCALDQSPGDPPADAAAALRAIAAETAALLARDRDARDDPVRAQSFNTVQGWLGVRTDTTRDGRPGLLVVKVAHDSPARRAGIRTADVLLDIDGQALWTAADVATALAGRMPGSTARLRLSRAGQELDCEVQVEPDRRRA